MSTEAARFAQTISQLTGRERRDAVACAVIETGGLYPYPMPRRALMEIQLHDVNASGMGEDQAIDNWIAAAMKPAIRATDGRPDCPYNGQGMAPFTPKVARSGDQVSYQSHPVADAQPRSNAKDPEQADLPVQASRRFEPHQVSPDFSIPPSDVHLIEPSQDARDRPFQTQPQASSRQLDEA